ncbi:U3 small nucleolar RNA-associated protein 6-domain-containing protein [Melanogaster broomeanus]|nr:U3 small nucleolar RNA-associated protein 6-domain-containing protein [Melanogaster broomeanus]
MERVQFQQEQMLAELKDLVQRSLFTQAEVKQIMKKRTQFETALVRRVAKKSDFLRYAAYEMSLEQLRRKRLQRMKLPKTKATISDYALVRRQFQIFERALKRFKSDVGLWIQYVQVANRENARALVGRITARALQLHPHVPSLYILAASHELSHMSPSAARSLLQRGLRLNSDSIDMWREYIRMELNFIEGMRRRWNVLGINIEDDESMKAAGNQAELGGDMEEAGETIIIDDQGEMPPNEVIAAEKGGDEGEAARRAIMDGAIVKSALLSASKALPKVELFLELETLIRTYPCQLRLRTTLLDHLYSLVQETIPDDPRAVKMHATRRLRELTILKEDSNESSNDDCRLADSEDLIDALQAANEYLTTAVNTSWTRSRSCGSTGAIDRDIADIYADFVVEWCQLPTLEPSLKQYLVGSLQALAQRSGAPPVLQATHIRVLLRDNVSPKKTLKLARRYSATSASPDVWLARLDVENSSDECDVKSAWASARAAVDASSDVKGAEKIWLWGLDHWSTNPEGQQGVYEDLLKQSMRTEATRHIHETLLLRYASDVIYSQQADRHPRLKLVRHVSSAYLPTKAVWECLFALESARNEFAKKPILSTIYEFWRALDCVSAASAWAGWLMERGEGKEAMNTIGRTMSQLAPEEQVRLSGVWSSRLKGEQTNDGDGDSSGEEDVS